MSTEIKKKQYGLVLNKKDGAATSKSRVAAEFADSDDEDTVDVMGKNRSASSIRVLKEAERMQERALAEDPSIFDYDASYDAIQTKKNEKIAEQKQKDKERKSKYAEDIIKSHKRRELEKQSRDERKQLKERDQEGDEFADKETFVTNAYKKQMEEVQKFREEEEYEARFNEATAVEKQQMWQSGFSRTLLSALARDGDEETAIKKEPLEIEENDDKATVSRLSKLKNMRKRVDSRSPSPQRSSREVKKEAKEKKSIYDSDDSDEDEVPPPRSMGLNKQGKNFEGELKPGLNKVVKRPPADVKVMTKFERLRKTFTPTSSEDERDKVEERRRNDSRERKEKNDRRDGDHRRDRDRHRRGERKNSGKEKGDEKKERKSEQKNENESGENKETPENRLRRLKEILKQRNGPAEIEEFRRRYLERKENGVVVPPI